MTEDSNGEKIWLVEQFVRQNLVGRRSSCRLRTSRTSQNLSLESSVVFRLGSGCWWIQVRRFGVRLRLEQSEDDDFGRDAPPPKNLSSGSGWTANRSSEQKQPAAEAGKRTFSPAAADYFVQVMASENVFGLSGRKRKKSIKISVYTP